MLRPGGAFPSGLVYCSAHVLPAGLVSGSNCLQGWADGWFQRSSTRWSGYLPVSTWRAQALPTLKETREELLCQAGMEKHNTGAPFQHAEMKERATQRKWRFG